MGATCSVMEGMEECADHNHRCIMKYRDDCKAFPKEMWCAKCRVALANEMQSVRERHEIYRLEMKILPEL